MSTQESTIGRAATSIGRFIFGLVALAVLLGIGYVQWPKIQATYQNMPAQIKADGAPAPTADTSAIKALQAQLQALQAQLKASQSSTVVQTVPKNEQPAQSIQVQPAPAAEQPATVESNSAAAAEPASRPVVIVQHDGYSQPVITGSGACQVAAKGARRCGK